MLYGKIYSSFHWRIVISPKIQKDLHGIAYSSMPAAVEIFNQIERLTYKYDGDVLKEQGQFFLRDMATSNELLIQFEKEVILFRLKNGK